MVPFPVFAIMFCAGLSALGLASEARAAVRICEAKVTGSSSGTTELEAKKNALDDWKSKAAAVHGENYTNWRLSSDRQLSCQPNPDSTFRCFATGRPCIIDNAPGTLDIRRKRQEI